MLMRSIVVLVSAAVFGLSAAACSAQAPTPTSTEDPLLAELLGRATPTATAQRSPTATPTPSYVPELSDYISVLGERYQGLSRDIYLREFENYVLVYFLAQRLVDLPTSRRSFMNFVGTKSLDDVRRAAIDQVNDLRRRYDAADRSEWIVLTVDADNAADSTIACRLTLVALVARIGGFAASRLLPSVDECPVYYAEYVANPGTAGDWLEYISRRMGVPTARLATPTPTSGFGSSIDPTAPGISQAEAGIGYFAGMEFHGPSSIKLTWTAGGLSGGAASYLDTTTLDNGDLYVQKSTTDTTKLVIKSITHPNRSTTGSIKSTLSDGVTAFDSRNITYINLERPLANFNPVVIVIGNIRDLAGRAAYVQQQTALDARFDGLTD